MRIRTPRSQPPRAWRAFVAAVTVALLFAGSGVPMATASAGSVTLYNNMTEARNVSGANADSTSGRWLASRFVAVQTGTANLISVAAQCLSNQSGNGCSGGTASMSIYSDSSGHPGTSLGATSAFQGPYSAPPAGNCGVLSPAPTLTAGTTYWAVMKGVSGADTSWLFQDGTASTNSYYSSDSGGTWQSETGALAKPFTLRIDQASACGGHLVPNPLNGVTIANMFPASGNKDVSTITLANDGIFDLNLTSWSLTGPDAAQFQVLDANVKDSPLPPNTVPQHYNIITNTLVIWYVTCTGGPTDAHYVASLTVTTDDPTQPSISWPLSCYVDNTPPVISFSPIPDGNAPWFRTLPANVGVTGDDGPIGSGTVMISCKVNDQQFFFTDSAGSASLHIPEPPAAEGAGATTIACIAKDAAGNQTPNASTTTISIDSHAPVISSSSQPGPNGAGWNNSDVAISFTCADATPGSGMATNTVGGGGTMSAETPFAGTGVTNTGSCIDVAGNVGASRTVTVKIDRTPPTTSIVSGPAVRTNNPTASFQLGGTDALSGVASYICTLDTGAALPCSANPSFPSLIDGTHTLHVRAVDAAGNTDSAGASASWYVDTHPPTASFDSPAEGAATQGNGSVAFHATDIDETTGFTFTCSLDLGTTAPCTSPFSYGFGASGSHQLMVTATDSAGNVGAPATLHFDVDAVPPTVTFTNPIEGANAAPSGTVTFTVVDPGAGPTPTAACKVDAQTPVACTSSHPYSGLLKGQHTAVVTATDAVGNITVATLNFHVGGTTTALASSGSPSVSGQSVTFTASVTSLSGTPTGTVDFVIDNTVVDSEILDNGSASFSIGSLETGGHAVEARYLGAPDYDTSTSAVLTQAVSLASTTTALTSTPNPVDFNRSVTFTATVTPVAPGSGTPTGTVDFLVDNVIVSTQPLDANGVATFSTKALAVGTRSIRAEYSNDPHFRASTGTLSQTVNDAPPQAETSTAIASSANHSVFGQSVTFTATVTDIENGDTPDGSIAFTIDGGAAGTVALDTTGHAILTISNLSIGGHPVGVTYLGGANFLTSTNSLTQTVDQASSHMALSSSANPSVFGQPVTFTAAVTAVAPGSGTPTGQVTFTDGSTTLGTTTMSGGVATFTTAALSVAGHPITAAYLGDTNFLGDSASLTQTTDHAATTTSVTSSQNPSTFGQSITLTATVTANGPGAGTAGGTVTFNDGATTLGSATLVDGVASFTTSAIGGGPHTISAAYGGDERFTGSSDTLEQSILKAQTSTVLATSVGPSVVGQSVTFTATVTSSAGTPAGSVTFLVDSVSAGSAPLDANGKATFTTSDLAVGSRSVSVEYGGNADYADSTDGLTQTVDRAATSVAVSGSVGSSVFGQSVTFTATMAVTLPGTGTPTGSVTFKDGTATLGTGTLSGGVATLATSALAVGDHSITAEYAGSASFTESVSITLSHEVNMASTHVALGSSLSPSILDQAVTFTATVTATAPGAGTPTGTLTFKDGATTLGSVTLSDGVATITTSSLAVGDHAMTATYSGDVSFAGSTSAIFPQTVDRIGTSTSVTSSVARSIVGMPVILTATVTGASRARIVTGTVQFAVDGVNVGAPATIRGGIATIVTTSLAVGTRSISATYSGSPVFAGSSGSLTHQVSYRIRTVSSRLVGRYVVIHVQITDFIGRNASSASVALTMHAPALSPSPAPGIQPTAAFIFVARGGLLGPMYETTFATSGFPRGTYLLRFTVAGDPITHTVSVAIR